MLDQQLFFGGVLNGAGDALAVLRSKDEGAQNQRVQLQRALQKFQSFAFFLG
jgi:hypothetical protein